MVAFMRRQDGGSPCGGRGAVALPSVAASCDPPFGRDKRGHSRYGARGAVALPPFVVGSVRGTSIIRKRVAAVPLLCPGGRAMDCAPVSTNGNDVGELALCW